MKRRNRAKPSLPTSPITVISLPGGRAFLRVGGLFLRCALGRSGVTARKREGDGATPAGRYRLLKLFYRRDRRARPTAQVPLGALRPNQGWCEAPRHGAYNRPLRLPSPAGHETMWRADHLYDLVGVLDWNIVPRASYRGSAIFLHLARPDYAPTEGCIALTPRDLSRLLARTGRNPEFSIMTKPRKRRTKPIAAAPRR